MKTSEIEPLEMEDTKKSKSSFLLIFIVIIVIVVVVVLLVFIFSSVAIGIGFALASSSEKQQEEIDPMTPFDDGIPHAQNAVFEMKAGWNLGNTLNSFAKFHPLVYENSQPENEKFEFSVSYESDPVSQSTDVSSSKLITTYETKFLWDISSLQSTGNVGNLKFRFSNEDISDSGNEELDFTIYVAEFTKQDGTVIELPDFLGDYSQKIQNKVTPDVVQSLSKVSGLTTTTDLHGGELLIYIRINSYPDFGNTPTREVSKEEYYETLFHNPVTTKPMIDMLKEMGFNAVRIPVTWFNHFDKNLKIDIKWLERVEEVINYVLDNEMFAILNFHDDTGANGWMKCDERIMNITGERYSILYEQVADYFINYDNKLLFENYNEILNGNSDWWLPKDDVAYSVANYYNQIFVNTIRKTGGNNRKRILVLNTYGAQMWNEQVQSFVLPEDPANDRLIVSVHTYQTGESDIKNIVNRFYTYFVQKGTPVIIGETGTTRQTSESTRMNHINWIVPEAKSKNITAFWWDDGNWDQNGQQNFALLDKIRLDWWFKEIAEAFISASEAN